MLGVNPLDGTNYLNTVSGAAPTPGMVPGPCGGLANNRMKLNARYQPRLTQWCLPVTVKEEDLAAPAYVPEIKTLVFDDTLWVLTIKVALV
jgi:hypothetical protein